MNDDLISRKAAIKTPVRFIKDCNPEHFVGHQKFIEFMDDAEIGSFGNWQFANGFNMGLTAAEVAIEKLPSAQMERRWIPCSKRSPDCEEKNYWVCDEEGYQYRCRWINYRFGLSGSWGWHIMDIPRFSRIVAWMPLPEPYKEKENEHTD